MCFLFVALASAHAQERTLQRTLDLPADGDLEISAFSGEIVITTSDEPQVRVEVRIEGDAQEAVDNTEIEFDTGRRSVSIETNFDGLDDPSVLRDRDDVDPPSTYFTIQMPRTASLEINAFSADVRVTDLSGDLDVSVFSSDVEITTLSGALDANLFSGDLKATGLSGPLSADTFSGNMELTFDTLTNDIEAETFSGRVRLYLPSDAGFEVDADLGMGGDLDSDFTLDGDEANGGGPRISFETFSGDLDLRMR